MKLFLTLSTLIFMQSVFGQKTKTLWVESDDVILQGAIGFESNPQLFVGQEYFFTIISNNKDFDLEIVGENLTVTLLPETKKGTGGLMFKVVPIDTGKCTIMLGVGNDEKRRSTLILKTFYASTYTIPPVFISGIRSGESISELSASSKIVCKYDSGLGIFESYPIKSWKAKLGDKEFSGTGNILSKELIDAVNQAKSNEVLVLLVELEKNNTGFTTSESVFILK